LDIYIGILLGAHPILHIRRIRVKKHDGEEAVGTPLIHTCFIERPLYDVACFLGRMYCMSAAETVLLVAEGIFHRKGAVPRDRQ
jgi:hypothetical protein